MSAKIRLATIDDAEAVAAIYAPYVTDTTISYELVPPTVDMMRERIAGVMKAHVWLVCEIDGVISGYAYAGRHNERAGYNWSVSVAVYVHGDYHRWGVGRGLYTTLLTLLRLQGYYNAFAGITQPNPASVGLHTAMGFELVGVYKNVGYKFGAWQDVAWYGLALQPHVPNPQPTIPIEAVKGSMQWGKAIGAGQTRVKVPQR